MKKIIVIAGAQSNVGKTSCAERLLSRLPSYSAIKVTTVKRSRCPRGDDTCTICTDFKRKRGQATFSQEFLSDGKSSLSPFSFQIISDRRIINQRGTDTARLKKAGAKRVLWLKASKNGLEEGLKKALSTLGNAHGVVIEGTSVLKYIKPHLTIYLKNNGKDIRSITKKALKLVKDGK